MIAEATENMEIGEQVHRILQELGPPDTQLRLFHYTDAAGLLGILSNDVLWASHIQYMNDSQEVEYGKEVIKEAIEIAKKAHPSERLQTFFDDISIMMGFDDLREVFVACFCEDGNLLSQWRAYAQHGAGFSIGFQFAPVSDSQDAVMGHEFRFRRVLYDKSKQLNMLARIFDCIAAYLEGASDFEQAMYACSIHFIRATSELSLCFKHSAFQEENEWRALLLIDRTDRSANPYDVKFRSSRNLLIPYIEQKIAASAGPGAHWLPIDQIYIGPSNNHNLAAKSLQWLIDITERPQAVEILKADIPLRA